MNTTRLALTALIAAAALITGMAGAGAAQTVDPEARAIAEGAIAAMGGQAAWDNTRLVGWKFFGGRQHYWDKFSGDIRIEVPASDRGPAMLVLMNLNSREGRVWSDGAELEGSALAEGLERGWRMWVNDAYWMFMPYKLLDPGVNLEYVGEDIMEDDREADVLQMTFESVGVTPQNRYLVYVAKDSGLVEQWSYFPERAATEPGFTMPWAGWEWFGDIMLATGKGRDADWDIHVWSDVPAGMFSDPDFGM
jgi:hypothetical protein